MGPHKADAHAKPEKPTQDLSLINSQKLLSVPPVSLRLRVLPWWFPVQELSNPMVFYLESWVAERIIGSDQDEISEIEWMSQALLSVNLANSGKLAEITIYGRPSAQIRMKNILLNMVAWYKEDEVQRAVKLKQVEEFLKQHASSIITQASKGKLDSS
ncbi:rCG25286 [Rattus norvegicus]|uniref:RCG25286 n=2 Tax=Rattus norvegicus TaxID=10116 RepID=A6I1J3_RAT|nr:rCG25286 [Rattus norvegicus]